MNYEYSISCERCGCKAVEGNMPEQVNLGNEDVLSKAQHNPRCPVSFYENRLNVRVLHSIETTDTATITHYILQLGK
jgi:hypothetical protein